MRCKYSGWPQKGRPAGPPPTTGSESLIDQASDSDSETKTQTQIHRLRFRFRFKDSDSDSKTQRLLEIASCRLTRRGRRSYICDDYKVMLHMCKKNNQTLYMRRIQTRVLYMRRYKVIAYIWENIKYSVVYAKIPNISIFIYMRTIQNYISCMRQLLDKCLHMWKHKE